MNTKIEGNKERMKAIESNLESLNKNRIASNVRIFGLQTNDTDDYNTLCRKVVNDVLNVACGDKEWSTDDIKRVFKIPQGDQSNAPIIAQLRYKEDKYRIYQGRDKLRDNGLSDDLTFKQRQQLKSLKQQGKSGYCYKGKLVIGNSTEGPTKQRVFVRAVRRSSTHVGEPNQNCNQEQNIIHIDTDTTMEHDDFVTWK